MIVIREYVEKLITTIEVKRDIHWVVDTIAFRFFYDCSVEPKLYSADLSINLSFHLDRCYQFFYINIYIYTEVPVV